jgi:hypothetical protein
LATTLVNPPTAVPANAAKAEMTDAFMERPSVASAVLLAEPAGVELSLIPFGG